MRRGTFPVPCVESRVTSAIQLLLADTVVEAAKSTSTYHLVNSVSTPANAVTASSSTASIGMDSFEAVFKLMR